ncbi:MAG: hypothetical protein ACLUNQ_00935 [Oscillospiraceae bacterium]
MPSWCRRPAWPSASTSVWAFCLWVPSPFAEAAGWFCIVAVYILLGNLPFQIIQRYNRPRLLRLMRKARKEK